MHILRKLAGQRPVSLYLMERYAEEVKSNPNQLFGELVKSLYAEIYQVLLEDDELLAVCQRIYDHGQQVKPVVVAEQPKGPAKPKKAEEDCFGFLYHKWISGQDMASTLLWAADFDLQCARRWYEHEDYELVESAINVKRQHDGERNRLLLEGPMFGFGGKYGGGKGPRKEEGEVQVHDLSGCSSKDMMAHIASFMRRS